MSRAKPAAAYCIGSLADADEVLGRMAELRRQVGEVEREMNEAIDRIKSDARERTGPLFTEIERHEAALKSFAELHKCELEQGRRSLVLNFGIIGFRRSRCIKPKSTRVTWKEIFGRIRELGLTEAIRTREELNREALASWPDESLEVVGARRVEREEFYYELAQETVRARAVHA